MSGSIVLGGGSLSSLERIEEAWLLKKDVLGLLSKSEDTIVMYK